MAELLEEQRENWGSRGGFILAAIGSAVGLGNLWKFPYELYNHGGGAFLIPYVIAVFVIGVPMLILEFSLGHFTQRAAPDAFGRSHKRFEFVGWWGIILGFVIITFYPVVLAYCISFLCISLQGIFTGGQLPWAGEGIEGVNKAKEFFYDTYLGYTEGTALGAVRLNILLPLAVAWLAMYFCIFRGVRLVSKIVWLTVPLPWLMLLVLTVRGLTLPGSMKGLAYYLNPVWSELAKPTTWQFAFGQAFFSLSLAFGVMITYASFLHRRSDINNNAAIIGLADFGTSFIAGLAIFATLGAMAYITQQAGKTVSVQEVVGEGPGLAFVVFPYALAQLPYSAWWSFVFFFTLVTLGIDSAFSITESVLAAVIDKTGWRRSIVLPVMSLVGFGIGIVYITKGGLNWLGTIADFINGTWGIAWVGLLECVVLGWLWRIEKLRQHANDRSDWKLGKWWDYLIRIVIPIILGSLFLWNLFNDFTRQEGFFVGTDGELILQNCVGMAVIGLAPVLSLLISAGKWRARAAEKTPPDVETETRGRLTGTAGLIFALLAIPAVIFVANRIITEQMDSVCHFLMFICLLMGIGAVLSGNSQLNRYNKNSTQASWLARWAGVIGVMDISAFIAIYLINMTRYRPPAAAAAKTAGDQLSVVSYVILSIVFLIIIGGLVWCFYRALTAVNKDTEIQHPDEIGDQGP